jgi:PAS domain S-box-containing protein
MDQPTFPAVGRGASLRPGRSSLVKPREQILLAVLGIVALGMMLMVTLSSSLRGGRDAQLAAAGMALFAGTVTAAGTLLVRARRRDSEELARVLVEREAAMESLQAATETVAASELRLRLMLDSAVDGIVELDARGTIVQANEAFGQMTGLPATEAIGRPWTQIAAQVGTADQSLAPLAAGGEAAFERDGQTVYLEARASEVPGKPPGTLLLIRDVTGTKVPEQTIRTLFHFLQDKDEDRTRILKRTDAAIEAERNRIARDLHDGPIQGIAAATLSLEAVRMMVQGGDMDRASEMLSSIRQELSDETQNLRRLMSDLRPPVLEERGLIPAVRDLCSRFEQEAGVPVSVSVQGPQAGDIPSDVETLAYRVIQEAMTNAGKHASATELSVGIEARNGTLTLDVSDNGTGFDPADAREFLRRGRVGLASMRERAELRGGELTVKSRPGAGTTVLATLPFDILPPAPGTSR